MRPAVRTVATDTVTIANEFPRWFNPTGSYPAIYGSGNIVNIATGAITGNIGGTAGSATPCKHVSLDLIIGCREPRNAASPFTAWSIAPTTVVATNIKAAVSHKGRLYVVDTTNLLEFTAVGQITGAIAAGQTYSLAPFMNGQQVIRLFSFTTNPLNSVDNILIACGDGGKVLMFSGDSPLAASWQLIANIDLPKPQGVSSFLEIDGDIWVSTIEYPYWMRDVFQGGAVQAYANSPATGIVENLWKNGNINLGPGLALIRPFCYYDLLTDSICTQLNSSFVGLNLIADYANDYFKLCYHRPTRSWWLNLSAPFNWPIVPSTNGSTLLGIGSKNNVQQLYLNYCEDLDQVDTTPTIHDIICTWKTPPMQTFAGRLQKLNGGRVYYENTADGSLKLVQTIFNMSDLNAPYGFYAQPSVAPINPASFTTSPPPDALLNSANQYTQLVGAVGQGINYSLQITQGRKSGSSDNTYHSFYGAALIIEEGGVTV